MTHDGLYDRLEDSVLDHLVYTGEAWYPDWHGPALTVDDPLTADASRETIAPRPRVDGALDGGSGIAALLPPASRGPDVVSGVAFPGPRFSCVVCGDLGCSHCPGVAA